MTKKDLAAFKALVQTYIVKHRHTTDYREELKMEKKNDALDFLEAHGFHGNKAKDYLNQEYYRQLIAMERRYEAMQELAVAAYYENDCDHEHPAVRDASNIAKREGKKLNIDPDDAESDIASMCFEYRR